MARPLDVAFVAGAEGAWRIDRSSPVVGAGLPSAARLDLIDRPAGGAAHGGGWALRGTTSNIRYTLRDEVASLSAKQEGLSRPEATRAALIPIRKTAAWWDLAQDERRDIFEAQSHHIAIGLDYLPGIARRLHHCRDLGEPFDFLTWFEFAPEHVAAFDHMVDRLRRSPEWRYVDREVDIRLSR